MGNVLTWKDVKKTCLQKLYSYSGEGSLMDSNNSEYLLGMPAVASEGIALLWSDCKTKKDVIVDISEQNGAMDLFEAIDDLAGVAGLEVYYYDASGIPRQVQSLQLIANRWLTIDSSWGGNILVRYTAKPEIITGLTADDYIMQCGDKQALMLPLYMASQLYKDDDISIATTYRNEFEEARSALKQDVGAACVDDTDCLWWD